MTDFKKIRKKPSYSKLKSIDVAMIHHESLRWLSESLDQSTTPVNIVVTHHAPSIRSVPAHHQSHIVTAAYASDLRKFIINHKRDYWFHGHLHSSSNYQLADCRVMCNPKGYKGEVNKHFDPFITCCVQIK